MKRDMSAKPLDIRDGLDHLRPAGSRNIEDIHRFVATTDLTTMRADIWIVYHDQTFEPLADVLAEGRFIAGPADGVILADHLNSFLFNTRELRETEKIGGLVAQSYIAEVMDAAGYPPEVIAEFTEDFLEKTLGAALGAIQQRAEQLVGPHGFKDSKSNAVKEIGADLTLRAAKEYVRRHMQPEDDWKDPDNLTMVNVKHFIETLDDANQARVRDIAFELSLNDEANKTAERLVADKQQIDFPPPIPDDAEQKGKNKFPSPDRRPTDNAYCGMCKMFFNAWHQSKHGQCPNCGAEHTDLAHGWEMLSRRMPIGHEFPAASREQLEQGVEHYDQVTLQYNESKQTGALRRAVEQAINHDYKQMETYARELLVQDCLAMYDAHLCVPDIRAFLVKRLGGEERIVSSVFEQFQEALGKRGG